MGREPAEWSINQGLKIGVVLPVGNSQISSFIKALSQKPNAVPESRT
jgi:hypothetical protein